MSIPSASTGAEMSARKHIDRRHLARLWDEGISLTVIALRFGMSKQTASRNIVRMGLPPRATSRRKDRAVMHPQRAPEPAFAPSIEAVTRLVPNRDAFRAVSTERIPVSVPRLRFLEGGAR